jgi:hypothetical protein
MRKSWFPHAEDLYGSMDSIGERYDKIQYYSACMGCQNRLADFGVLKRPPKMTWLMDAESKERELGRWKDNGWYTEPDMTGYGDVRGGGKGESAFIRFQLGESVLYNKSETGTSTDIVRKGKKGSGIEYNGNNPSQDLGPEGTK